MKPDLAGRKPSAKLANPSIRTQTQRRQTEETSSLLNDRKGEEVAQRRDRKKTSRLREEEGKERKKATTNISISLHICQRLATFATFFGRSCSLAHLI